MYTGLKCNYYLLDSYVKHLRNVNIVQPVF